MTVDELIAARHSKDLIVSECKDGPTSGASHLRLDWWVMRRSWTNPAFIGYELKRSRNDFLRDDKWPGYLPLCNELWFVDDGAAIQAAELPESVGLLRPAGSRFRIVRKAAYREIEPPIGLLLYVLMCRTKIKARWTETDGTTEDYWAAWLAAKHKRLSLGRSVSRKLARTVAERITELEGRQDSIVRERNEAVAERKKIDEIADMLDARGVRWRGWQTAESATDEVLNVNRWMRKEVENVRDALTRMLGEVVK